MSALLVVRNSGDKRGADISEPLLSSDSAKIARGISELDSNAHSLEKVSITILYRPGLELGQIVKVVDSTQGADYLAKITGIDYKYSAANVSVTLSLDKPTDFYA